MNYSRAFLMSLCYWWKPSLSGNRLLQTSRHCTIQKPLSSAVWNDLRCAGILKRFRGTSGRKDDTKAKPIRSIIPSNYRLNDFLSKLKLDGARRRNISNLLHIHISSSGSSESTTTLTHSTINSSTECLERPAGSRSQLEQSMLLSSKKCWRLGNTNARSLKNKTKIVIDHVTDKKMDVCVVTETWMNDNDSVTTAALSPQGYTFRNVPRESDRSCGGTTIIFRDSFNVSLIDSKQRSSFEISEWNVTALQMDTLQNLSSSIDLLTLKLILSLPMFSLKNSLHIWNLLSSVMKTLLSLVILTSI